jgi:methylaspartate mutase sigma subunit
MQDVLPASRRVLLSTVSSDSHTWNLVFLQLFLQESGHEVINMGPCVPDELLLHTARREQPDAIVISTVNGHGQADGARVARILRGSAGTSHIPLMIGGKLGISGTTDEAIAYELLDAGFDFVFTDDSDASLLTDRLTELE